MNMNTRIEEIKAELESYGAEHGIHGDDWTPNLIAHITIDIFGYEMSSEDIVWLIGMVA